MYVDPVCECDRRLHGEERAAGECGVHSKQAGPRHQTLHGGHLQGRWPSSYQRQWPQLYPPTPDAYVCVDDQASSGKLLRKHGYFDLLGCDFMLSATNQLFLLEVNTNPALSLDNSTLEQLLPGTGKTCVSV